MTDEVIVATDEARNSVWGPSVIRAEIRGRTAWVLAPLAKPRRRLDKKTCRYILYDLWLSVTATQPSDIVRVYADEYHLLTAKEVQQIVRGGKGLFETLKAA